MVFPVLSKTPIPSLSTTRLLFEDGSWKYSYAYEAKQELPEKRKDGVKYSLCIDRNGFISLKKPNGFVNIEICTKKDLKDYMDAILSADIRMRRNYAKNCPDKDLHYFVDAIKTFTLKNRTQYINAHIVYILKQTKTETIFVGTKSD